MSRFIVVALNQGTREEDRNILREWGIDSYREVTGVYKGVEEASYIVPILTALCHEVVLAMAWQYSQECVLEVDTETKGAWLVYPNSPCEYIGQWKRTSEAVARNEAEYTKEGDNYYVVK